MGLINYEDGSNVGTPYFTECILAIDAMLLASLGYLWLQGHVSLIPDPIFLLLRVVFFLEIKHPDQVLAYYSLAGQRDDFPDTIVIVPLESTICA
ncbi:hypothetical protein PIB30_055344 [Stylosanthes scabra]|uniref:Uncharacterized protein n=1 Tax=Stylosanthes scabra TaxID=79078 RepID=A0ABU6VH78_9FABA|nr:hypothetical protein [Stylosanthes scabra]